MSQDPRRRLGFLRDTAVSFAVALALWIGCEVTLRVASPQVSRTEEVDGQSRAVEDSVLGHRYRPGARAIHRTPEFTAEYVIDADGRRAGTRCCDSLGVRVLILGDSFAFGAGVPSDSVWTVVMARTLAARGLRVDVINAGVEAYDTRSETRVLAELAPQLQPDIVLLSFLANDVYTNQPLHAAPRRSSEEQRGEGFALHSVAWAKRLAMQNDRLYSLLFLVTRRKEYYRVPASEQVALQFGVTRTLIDGMQSYCHARGIEFAVVSIPQLFTVLATARDYRFDGLDPSAIDANLAGLSREREFAWIEMESSLAAAYRTTRADMYYRVDGHLTAAGNRVVGERAAKALAPMVARHATR